MPHLIAHRINTLAQLRALPAKVGAEIDLRSDACRPGHVHLSHDPFAVGESLLPWLDAWAAGRRGTLVLNTKEDGLEHVARDACRARGIDDFVFLDTQLPTLVRLAKEGWGRHLALRLSAFEPLEALAPWRTLERSVRPRMLWVDCFGGRPLAPALLQSIGTEFEACLVSPELQGQAGADLDPFRPLAERCHWICSKRAMDWGVATSSSESLGDTGNTARR